MTDNHVSHLIRIDEDMLVHISESAHPGSRVALAWGEPDAGGVYQPTLTTYEPLVWGDERSVGWLAEALHEVMCTISHHDPSVREARCFAKFPHIARAAIAVLGRLPVR